LAVKKFSGLQIVISASSEALAQKALAVAVAETRRTFFPS
jgi:hypothetical protein